MTERRLASFRRGLGTTVVWAALGAVLVGCVGFVAIWSMEEWPAAAGLPGSPLRLASLGASAGAVFGLLLRGLARGKSLDHLSLRRTALWGFLAGIIGPALFVLLSNGGLPEGPVSWRAYLPQVVGGMLGLGALFAGLGVGVTLVAKAARSDDEALDSMKEDLL